MLSKAVSGVASGVGDSGNVVVRWWWWYRQTQQE